MHYFQNYLLNEKPAIDNAVNTAIAAMPLPCRDAASHILNAGGKRLRPLLTILCARLLGYTSDRIYNLAASMELLHAATLLHDDVLDNSNMRRNHKAAHIVFGSTKAILVGDAMLAAGNAIVAAYNNPDLTLAYSTATIQTAAGEILEMSSLRNPDLTWEEYLDIIKGKTACLIAQSCRLGGIIASATISQLKAIECFGENLGIAFQLVDDALDFESPELTGKPGGGDLREGKITPVLRYFRDDLSKKERAEFDNKFSNNTFEEADIITIIQCARKYIPKVRSLASTYLDIARNALQDLPQIGENNVLNQLIDFVGSRSN